MWEDQSKECGKHRFRFEQLRDIKRVHVFGFLQEFSPTLRCRWFSPSRVIHRRTSNRTPPNPHFQTVRMPGEELRISHVESVDNSDRLFRAVVGFGSPLLREPAFHAPDFLVGIVTKSSLDSKAKIRYKVARALFLQLIEDVPRCFASGCVTWDNGPAGPLGY